MTFAAGFADEMPDTLIAQPGNIDLYGAFAPSGSALAIPCRIEGGNRLTRTMEGKQVISTVQCILDGPYNLTTDLHRYTLPSRFIPSGDLQAINIVREADEDGPCYEEVWFP